MMKDRISRSIFWMAWSRGGIQILTLLGTLLVARLLSPDDYGLMALAGIWIGSIELLAEMGLGAAIVQFRDLEERELNACFWLTITVACIAYGILCIAAPGIAAWFSEPALSTVLPVAALTLPLVAIRVVPDSLLRKRLALDRIAKAEIVAAAITSPLMIALAWTGAGVWALVAGAISLPLIQTVITLWFARWIPGIQVKGRRVSEILRYSVTALGARLAWAIFSQVDAFVVGTVSGEAALGFYSMAMRLGTMPVSKVTIAANQLATPIMAELQSDRDAMRVKFLRGLRLVTCITVPLSIGMALVAPDLIPIVLTDKWIPAVPVLQVLCIYALIRSVDTLLPPVLFARYRVSYVFWWTVTLLVVMPAMFWIGAKWSGPFGVAMSWIVVYPILTAFMVREALRELELTWKDLWNELRPLAGASLAMACAVVIVSSAISGDHMQIRILRLAACVSAGAFVYVFSIFRFDHLAFSEASEVAGWIFRRNHVLTPTE